MPFYPHPTVDEAGPIVRPSWLLLLAACVLACLSVSQATTVGLLAANDEAIAFDPHVTWEAKPHLRVLDTRSQKVSRDNGSPEYRAVRNAQWAHAGDLAYPLFHASPFFLNRSLFLLGGCPTMDCSPPTPPPQPAIEAAATRPAGRGSRQHGLRDARYYTSVEYNLATGVTTPSKSLLPLQDEHGVAGKHVAVAITGTVYIIRSCSLSFSAEEHEVLHSSQHREAVVAGEKTLHTASADSSTGSLALQQAWWSGWWSMPRRSPPSRLHETLSTNSSNPRGGDTDERTEATSVEAARADLAVRYSPIIALYPELPAINESFFLIPSHRARVNASCTALGNRILIMGGVLIESGKVTGSVDAFDVVTHSYEEDVAQLEEPVMSPSVAAASESTVVVAGGWSTRQRRAGAGEEPATLGYEAQAAPWAPSQLVSILTFEFGEDACVKTLGDIPVSVRTNILADPHGCNVFLFSSHIVLGSNNMTHVATFDLRAADHDDWRVTRELQGASRTFASPFTERSNGADGGHSAWRLVSSPAHTNLGMGSSSTKRVEAVFAPIVVMTTELIPLSRTTSTSPAASPAVVFHTMSSSGEAANSTTSTTLPPVPRVHNMSVMKLFRIGGEALVHQTTDVPSGSSSATTTSSCSSGNSRSCHGSSEDRNESNRASSQSAGGVHEGGGRNSPEADDTHTDTAGQGPLLAPLSTEEDIFYLAPSLTIESLLLDNGTAHNALRAEANDIVPAPFLFMPVPDLPLDYVIEAPTGEVTLGMPPGLDYTAYCRAPAGLPVVVGGHHTQDGLMSRFSAAVKGQRFCFLRLSSRRDCLGNAAGTLDTAYDGAPGAILGFSATGSSWPVYVCLGVQVHLPASPFNPFEPSCKDRAWFNVLNPRLPLAIDARSTPTSSPPPTPSDTSTPGGDSSNGDNGGGGETVSAILYILCAVAVLTLIVAVLLVAKLQRLPEEGLLAMPTDGSRSTSRYLAMTAEERRRRRRLQRAGTQDRDSVTTLTGNPAHAASTASIDGHHLEHEAERHRMGPREREARAAEQLLLQRIDIAGAMVRRHGQYRVLSRIGESTHSLVFLVMRKSGNATASQQRIHQRGGGGPGGTADRLGNGSALQGGETTATGDARGGYRYHALTHPFSSSSTSSQTLVLKLLDLPSESIRAEVTRQCERLRDLPDYHPFLVRPLDIVVNYDYEPQLLHESLMGLLLAQQQQQQHHHQSTRSGGGGGLGEGSAEPMPLPMSLLFHYGPHRPYPASTTANMMGGGYASMWPTGPTGAESSDVFSDRFPRSFTLSGAGVIPHHLAGAGGGATSALPAGGSRGAISPNPFDDDGDLSPLSKDETGVFISDSDDDVGSEDDDGDDGVRGECVLGRKAISAVSSGSVGMERAGASTAPTELPHPPTTAASPGEPFRPAKPVSRQSSAASHIALVEALDGEASHCDAAPPVAVRNEQGESDEAYAGSALTHESTATYIQHTPPDADDVARRDVAADAGQKADGASGGNGCGRRRHRQKRRGPVEGCAVPAAGHGTADRVANVEGISPSNSDDDERLPLLSLDEDSRSLAYRSPPAESEGQATRSGSIQGKSSCTNPVVAAPPCAELCAGGKGRRGGRRGRGGRGRGVGGVRWTLLAAQQRWLMPTRRYAFVVMPYERHGDLARFVQQQQQIAKLERELEGVQARKRGLGFSDLGRSTGADQQRRCAAGGDISGGYELFPECVVVSVAYQLCSALAHLHGQNPPFLHGAVTGSNVLIRDPAAGYTAATPVEEKGGSTDGGHTVAVPVREANGEGKPQPHSPTGIHLTDSPSANSASFSLQQDFTQVLRQGAEALTYLPVRLADGGMVSWWTLDELPWRLTLFDNLFPLTAEDLSRLPTTPHTAPPSRCRNVNQYQGIDEEGDVLGGAPVGLADEDDASVAGLHWRQREGCQRYQAETQRFGAADGVDDATGEEAQTTGSTAAGSGCAVGSATRLLQISRDGRRWLEDPSDVSAFGRFLAFFLELPGHVAPEQVLSCLIATSTLPAVYARALVEGGALQGTQVQLPLQRRFLAYRQWQQRQEASRRHLRKRKAKERRGGSRVEQPLRHRDGEDGATAVTHEQQRAQLPLTRPSVQATPTCPVAEETEAAPAHADGAKQRRTKETGSTVSASSSSSITAMSAQHLAAQVALVHYIAHHATAADMWGLGCVLFSTVMGLGDGFHERCNMGNPFIQSPSQARFRGRDGGPKRNHADYYSEYDACTGGGGSQHPLADGGEYGEHDVSGHDGLSPKARLRRRCRRDKLQAIQQRYDRNLSARAVAALIADLQVVSSDSGDGRSRSSTDNSAGGAVGSCGGGGEAAECAASTAGRNAHDSKAHAGAGVSSQQSSTASFSHEGPTQREGGRQEAEAGMGNASSAPVDDNCSDGGGSDSDSDSANSEDTSVQRQRQRLRKMFSPVTPTAPLATETAPVAPQDGTADPAAATGKGVPNEARRPPFTSPHATATATSTTTAATDAPGVGSSTSGGGPGAAQALDPARWPACLRFEDEIKTAVRHATLRRTGKPSMGTADVTEATGCVDEGCSQVYSDALASLIARLLSPLPSRRPRACDLQRQFRLILAPHQQQEYRTCLGTQKHDSTNAPSSPAAAAISTPLAGSLKTLGSSLLDQLQCRQRPSSGHSEVGVAGVMGAGSPPSLLHSYASMQPQEHRTPTADADCSREGDRVVPGTRLYRLLASLPVAPSMGGFDERAAEIVLAPETVPTPP